MVKYILQQPKRLFFAAILLMSAGLVSAQESLGISGAVSVEQRSLSFEEWRTSQNCRDFEQSRWYKDLTNEIVKNAVIGGTGYIIMAASAAYLLYTAGRSIYAFATETSIDGTNALIKAGLGSLGAVAGYAAYCSGTMNVRKACSKLDVAYQVAHVLYQTGLFPTN